MPQEAGLKITMRPQRVFRPQGCFSGSPDDVLGLVADVFEVQMEAQALQGEVPQTAQPAHLVREGAQAPVVAHVQ